MNNIIIIYLIASVLMFPQTRKVGEVNIYTDFAQFQGNSEQTILEIFYSIPRISIAHIETEEGLVGEYKFNCKIFQNDSLVNETSWGGRDIAESEDEIIANQTINDYHLLLLKPNEYVLEIDFINNSDEKVFSTSQNLTVEDFNEPNLNLSSLQFCSQIEQTKLTNRFVKNGYQLTLNPSSIFGTQRPILFYYSEIYNLNGLSEDHDSTYSIFSKIIDSNGEIIHEIPVKIKRRLGSSLVQVGQLYIGSLKSGSYDFALTIVDNSLNDSTTNTKRFFVYRPADFIASNKNYDSEDARTYSAFLVYTEEELDREFNFVRYISSSDEKDIYEDLNLVGKRDFLEKFWTKKNKSKYYTIEDYRREYFSLIDFANQRYTVGSKGGWETNAGRIILTYGKPDELDRFSNQSTMGHYEIWQYYQAQGGIQFVFVDANGYGDLRLVHSTSVNEIQDYEWRKRYLQ